MPEETVEAKLKSLGITLPPIREPMANYVPFVIAGKLLFLSGQGPAAVDGTWLVGKVGENVTAEEAYQHARLTGIHLLSVVHSALGSLDRVDRVVKILGFVNACPSFKSYPKIINGCSDLMVEVFGERGRHARSAVGVIGLPENITVEIEAVFEIRQS